MSGEQLIPINKRLYWYKLKGVAMVHKFELSSSNWWTICSCAGDWEYRQCEEDDTPYRYAAMLGWDPENLKSIFGMMKVPAVHSCRPHCSSCRIWSSIVPTIELIDSERCNDKMSTRSHNILPLNLFVIQWKDDPWTCNLLPLFAVSPLHSRKSRQYLPKACHVLPK